MTSGDHPAAIENAACQRPDLCPLNRVREGGAARIRQLTAPPELERRLRELGFCEDQKVRLLSQQATIICQVCNARLAISRELAERILVEPLPGQRSAA